ncbi:MAG: PAS domain S-box protein [Deltaproteobacteria bacterium]|nr:PAS domain S-box protein [Deltaproteobacteria bacterium]
MEDPLLYNSRLIKNYVEYLRKYYPQIDPNDILEYAGIETYGLEESGQWLTQKQVDRFHEKLNQLTDNSNISREVGRFSFSGTALGPIKKYAFGFLSPSLSYLLAEKIANKITRTISFKVKKLGGRKVEIRIELKPGVKEGLAQCENRIGIFEVQAKLYTKKMAHVDHPECVHRGGEICRYIVSWEKTSSYIWKLIRNYSFPVNFLLNLALYFVLPFDSWIWLVKICVLINMGIIILSEHMEKKELIKNITEESEATQSLLNETNRRYNEVLLIQEIGQTLSMILDIDVSLRAIMEAMSKRLDFDRGMILLADKEKIKLNYVTGYGYDHEDEEYFKKVEFGLDNPKSQGMAVESFRKQIPFLINNTDEVEKKLSLKSMEFLRRVGTQSFICVPIVYKEESLGILLVDNLTSKRPLTQGDLSLLMGIAPQIAININNAVVYNKIRESEERFRSLSENTPDIVFALDHEGIFSYVNPAWERILGHSPSEVIGRKMIDFVKREDSEKFQQLFDQVWGEKTIIRDVLGTFLQKDGKEKIFSASGAPNFDPDGNVTSLVGILRDITEQALLESQLRQAKKMEAIGTLAGGIAHDFNNLLMGIQGYTSLILMTMDETHPFYEKLDGINQQVRSGVDLTRQLLGFARGGKYEVRPVNINLILQKSAEMFGRTKKEVRIHSQIQEDLWTVEVDQGQIEQALLNLFVNAWQAMPGGGSLYLKTRNIVITSYGSDQPRPGKYVKISIRDTGEGMEEKVIERIFEPFFTTKEMGRGTGLGLAMVYGIIKSHGGSIFASSQKGQGSTFSIYLPASDKKMVPEEKPQEKPVRGQETILLVDDEEVILKVTREILESLGYLVLSANSGQEALSLFREKHHEIDMIILDMIMPDLKGSQTYDGFKEVSSPVKVLLSSGYSIDGQAALLIERGCKAFIQKPYTVSELSQKVREVLDLP